MRTYNKIIAPADVILVRDQKILMMRRFNTGFEDGNYGFPAGHVEELETPRQTAVREAKEEAGVDIDIADLEFVDVIHRLNHTEAVGEQQRVEFYFVARKWIGEPHIAEPSKCDHLEWFALDALPKNIVHYCPQVIEAWQKGIGYSEMIQ